jgi:glycosyltransferase involved in cell wall biosynthesis
MPAPDPSNEASVVHLDTARVWRGGQLQVFLLHRELLHRGVPSRLLARAGGGLHRRCVDQGLPVEPVGVMRPWYPPALRTVRRFTRAAAIVHAHDSHAASLAAVARVGNPALKVVCHRRIAYSIGGPMALRWKYRRTDLWIAVSAEIAGILRAAGVGRCSVVPSAVDVSSFLEAARTADLGRMRSQLRIEDRAPVVGLVGAFTRQKGHDVLLRAAPTVLAAAPDTVFLCVGEGRLRSQFQRRISTAGLEGAFRFTGFRDDVAALMALPTVLVAPSLDGEGSSAALKEAMVLGRVIVATDLPGNLEVLGGAGITVPVGDADALAEAVVGLLGDSSRREELSAAGRAQTERFRPEAMAAGVRRAYDSLRRGSS